MEDEDAVRELAEVVLERNGYQVITARTAADALAIASTPGRTFDVLVTDVMMPNMTGPQLARRLRELRPELNVLFMSGYTANAILDQGLLETGVPFLSKPFSPTSLALAVRSVLDGHADQRNPRISRLAQIRGAAPHTPAGQGGIDPRAITAVCAGSNVRIRHAGTVVPDALISPHAAQGRTSLLS